MDEKVTHIFSNAMPKLTEQQRRQRKFDQSMQNLAELGWPVSENSQEASPMSLWVDAAAQFGLEFKAEQYKQFELLVGKRKLEEANVPVFLYGDQLLVALAIAAPESDTDDRLIYLMDQCQQLLGIVGDRYHTVCGDSASLINSATPNHSALLYLAEAQSMPIIVLRLREYSDD